MDVSVKLSGVLFVVMALYFKCCWTDFALILKFDFDHRLKGEPYILLVAFYVTCISSYIYCYNHSFRLNFSIACTELWV